ncbi:uncharacterized protein BHQ10_003815 [Talaromyces amestolkiae]|uniref:AB hydrolase-1 domain-containing protein n=1 Tax=Talaromyces amestolkiae TaxID=1196081 RepID=A0A364KW91_TALAM|nr:uncharacterized protein BHQ10_003815 [Talaromyces amestolkiae]RAO67803.1 hypothetical protein BHQ10_003815 [Talaromyces amestolkiae]
MDSRPSKPYHVQQLVDNPDAFPHHSSVSALWNLKWKGLAVMAVYPFGDGKAEDFQEVFNNLIEASGDDYQVFYDPEAYAAPFFPVGKRLLLEARAAESTDKAAARDLYLRAAAVFRIARFPINRSPASQMAWQYGKEAYMAASPYLDPPNQQVVIPHTHRDHSAGDGDNIYAYLRVPDKIEKPEKGWPVVLFICGLDAYRTDHTTRTQDHVHHGFACLSVDIPGTGDSPAAPGDTCSPDRQWSSVLDWIASPTGGQMYDLNEYRVIARGVSTGGYYAMRIAHTHSNRLKAVVAQGGGSHHMFDEAWIRAQNHMEYPFALANALAAKFGSSSVEDYINSNPRARFSLEENGIFDMPCTRLLVINGMEDSIFPIEDSILACRRGRVKDARFIDSTGHMGNPGAEEIIYEWIDEVAGRN